MTDRMTESRPAPAPDRRGQARQSLVLPILLPVAIMVIIGLVLLGFSRVLLSVSAGAATVVALIVATSIMAVATIIASRSRLSNGSLFSMVGAIAGIAMLAGGVAIVVIGTGEETGAEPGPEPQRVSLAAPEGAAAGGYAQTNLQVEADRPTALDFDNQDPGVPHNVVIFGEDPADNPQATPIFSGAIITGPLQTTYDVPPLEAGTYFFHCEVHPTTMTGTIESGGATGGIAVVAEGLQFDTKELDLPAGQPVTISFENKDAGIPHNIAIYTDASKSTVLFQGEVFPGPATKTYSVDPLEAEEYYFQCDVHPAMNGTVVVEAGDATGGGGPSGGPSESPPSG
jgi:plastocyanin